MRNGKNIFLISLLVIAGIVMLLSVAKVGYDMYDEAFGEGGYAVNVKND